jgi:hypothetical protein
MRFLGKAFGFKSEIDNGNSGASITVTLANGQKQKLTLTANTTVTIAAGTGCPIGNYQLRLIQDATGSRTLTWAGLSASRWLGSAAAPAINAAASGETIVSIYWDGTNFTQSLAKVGAV